MPKNVKFSFKNKFVPTCFFKKALMITVKQLCLALCSYCIVQNICGVSLGEIILLMKTLVNLACAPLHSNALRFWMEKFWQNSRTVTKFIPAILYYLVTHV